MVPELAPRPIPIDASHHESIGSPKPGPARVRCDSSREHVVVIRPARMINQRQGRRILRWDGRDDLDAAFSEGMDDRFEPLGLLWIGEEGFEVVRHEERTVPAGTHGSDELRARRRAEGEVAAKRMAPGHRQEGCGRMYP